MCMFAYLYVRPLIRRRLGSASNLYINFTTAYIGGWGLAAGGGGRALRTPATPAAAAVLSSGGCGTGPLLQAACTYAVAQGLALPLHRPTGSCPPPPAAAAHASPLAAPLLQAGCWWRCSTTCPPWSLWVRCPQAAGMRAQHAAAAGWRALVPAATARTLRWPPLTTSLPPLLLRPRAGINVKADVSMWLTCFLGSLCTLGALQGLYSVAVSLRLLDPRLYRWGRLRWALGRRRYGGEGATCSPRCRCGRTGQHLTLHAPLCLCSAAPWRACARCGAWSC